MRKEVKKTFILYKQYNMWPCFAVMARHGFLEVVHLYDLLFFLGVEKFVVPVEVVVSGEGCDETGNLLDGILGFGCYLLALETQHQHTVESIETGLNFGQGVVTGLGAKLDDEGEGFVKFGGIFGIAGVFHQGEMKVGKLNDDVFVELDMA